jgi:hypothetical protein
MIRNLDGAIWCERLHASRSYLPQEQIGPLLSRRCRGQQQRRKESRGTHPGISDLGHRGTYEVAFRAVGQTMGTLYLDKRSPFKGKRTAAQASVDLIPNPQPPSRVTLSLVEPTMDRQCCATFARRSTFSMFVHAAAQTRSQNDNP